MLEHLLRARHRRDLSTLGSKACRDDMHTQAKCQVSPYAGDPRRDYAGESPAVNPPKTSGGQ